MNEDTNIKEAIKIENGKPKYCLQVTQGESKMQVYIRSGEIYFEACRYGFDNYPIFEVENQAHQIAKEVFVSSLKTDIKNKILELKQLEIILDDIGLKQIIDDEVKQGGVFLTIKRKLLGEKVD